MLKTILFAATLPTAAYAGPNSSGGGKFVVCRDAENVAQSATVLDLYEAVHLYGLTLVKPAAGIAGNYVQYLTAMRTAVDDSDPVSATDLDYLSNMIDGLNFPPAGTTLPWTPDLGPTAPLAPGCAIEQLAVYDDDTNVLSVDRVGWLALDSQNQAALLAHEEIYHEFRSAGEWTSANVRHIVGELFSTTPPIPVDSGVPSDALRCFTSDASEYYIYADPEAPGSTTLQFIQLSGRETMSLSTLTIPLAFSALNLSQIGIVKGSIGPSTYSAMLDDGILAGAVLNIDIVSNEALRLTWLNPDGDVLDPSTNNFCLSATNHSR